MKSYQWWWVIGTVFLVIGIVSALGEWVFHWWEDPGQYLAVIGLVVGLISYATAATGSDLDRLGNRLATAEGQDRLMRGQERLISGQQEQTALLQRLVDSFRGR